MSCCKYTIACCRLQVDIHTLVPYTTGMVPDLEIVTKRVLKATIKNFNGVTIKGEKGDKGDKGDDGYTPIKGIDYFDGEDGKKGEKGTKGDPAYTPIKGVDYFDGEDGKDGVNGLDGKDGRDGSPDTPEQVRDKLSSLEGEERLDAKHIKNLPKTRGGGISLFGSLLDVDVSGVTNGQVPVYNSTTGKWENGTAGGGVNEDSFGVTVDGAGVALTTGSKGYKSIPWDCTITGWVVTAKEVGSIVFDVKKSTYAGFPTTSSIAGSEKPTLSSSQKNQDLSLSTWTTSLTAGDVVEFVVDSASTVTRATLTILVSKI